MTIAATYAKLCALAAASSGIVTAPTGLPDTLTEDALPCVITIVGPAEWNEHAQGLYRQVRTYEQRVFVRPVSATPLDDGYAACLAPLYALGRTYVQNSDLDGTVDHIGERGEFTDSGVSVLNWADTPYHGFTITLRITEKAS